MASYTREEFIEKYNKKLGVDTPVRPATTSAKSAFMQEYKEKYEAKYPTTEKGQAYSAPVVVQPAIKTEKDVVKQENYNQMQQLFNRSDDKKELARITNEINAISGYGAGADRSNLQNLYQQKDQLEQRLKTGRYDEDLNALERLQLTGQGIGEGYNYTPDVLVDTAVQALKGDATVNMESDAIKGMQRANQASQQAMYGKGALGQFGWGVAGTLMDNAARMPLMLIPGGKAINSALAGTRTTAQKIVEVGEKGGTARDAFLRGVGSGAVEAGTEALGFDVALNTVLKNTGEGILKDMLVNAATGAGEEGLAYLGNLAIDKLAKDPDAKFSWEDLGMVMASGAVAEGILGGGASVIGNRIRENNITQSADDANTEESDVNSATKVREKNVADTNDGNIGTDTNVDTNNAEKEQLKAEVAKIMGIDTRTEAEKVAQEQQSKVAMVQELANEGIATQEDVIKAQTDAQTKIEEANSRQINLDYQKIDTESGAVRTKAIKNGYSKVVERIEKFAAKRGLKVKFFEGDKYISGFEKDGTIYINVTDPKVMYKTAIHESLHALRTNNQAEFDALKKAVFEAGKVDKKLFMSGVKTELGYVNSKSESVQASIRNEDGTVNRDVVEEEVLAKMCEELHDNPQKFIDKMNGDRTAVQAIIDFVKELIDSTYIEFSNSEKAQMRKAVREAEKALERYMQKEAGITTDVDGKVVAEDDKKGGIKFNIETYETSGRDYLRKWLENSDLTEKDKADIIDGMERAYDAAVKFKGEYPAFSQWSEATPIVDAEGKPVMSVVVTNGEYDMNIDFSTVCKKRKALDAVLNEIVKSGKLNLFEMSQPDVVRMNEIIKENGFEVACALCFVDAKRYRIGNWANSFTDYYNTVVESLIPKNSDIGLDQFNFADANIGTFEGTLAKDVADDQLDWTYVDKLLEDSKTKPIIRKIAQAVKEDPSMRRLLSSGDLLSSAGADGMKAQNSKLYGIVNTHMGSAKPKTSHSETPYMNDVLRNNNFAPEAAYAVGGVRIQSFSDYVPSMVFDYVQMVGDLAAKKLPAHAYTKEIPFVKLFGKTGIKINMSLVPKVADFADRERLTKLPQAQRKKDPVFKKMQATAGLDENGNYLWADETFDYDTAIKLQNNPDYSKNVGTIAVGVSDAHIRKLLADDNIRMVIPYHKSGINHIVASMRNIDLFNDYTKVQNTRYKSTGKKIRKDAYHFDFYADLAQTNDPRKTAENYVKDCESRGFLPKFDKFAYKTDAKGNRVVDDNYYKLLIDFAVYDKGEYTPQSAVKMDFPEKFNEFVSESLATHEATAQKMSNEMSSLVKQIEDAIGKKDGVKFSADAENNIKNTNNLLGKSSINTDDIQIPAEYEGKTLDEILDLLINKHGAIEQGEKPVREISVPKKSMDGKKVSKFARTVAEAEATPEDFARNNLLDMAAKGDLSHEVVTDKLALDRAESILRNKGWDEALDEWNALNKTDKAPNKYDIALGQMLYNEAVNNGDTELAQKLVCDLCVQATRAGQTVQAFRLLKKLTPEGKLYMLQKSLDQINREQLERYKSDYKDIEIPTELADKLLKAKDTQTADAAVEEIEQYIADQIPPTIADKFNAWRYLAMLGNPRTHIRNVVGNAMFSPFKAGKDIIGAQLEKAIVKDGVKTKATVSKKSNPDLWAYAEKDFAQNESAIKGEAKYDGKNGIKEKQRVFDNKYLEKARKFNTDWLEKEDIAFLKNHYVRALAGAMKANGITAKTANNLENQKVMAAIKTYATNEAQKATYRDVNAFSKAVQNAKKALNKNSASSVFIEGILPFARTPANIIARGVEYSPVGVARGAVNLATGGIDTTSVETTIASIKQALKGVKSGKYTTAEALDQLSAGLTGTAICALGYILASIGWAKGKEDDGGKEGDLEKLYGIQDYSLMIGNISYTIDWAAPAAMPFFVGVELYNAFSDTEESSGIVSALLKITDPVFEMSMLDGINNAIQATAYTDTHPVIAMATSSVLNYAGQAVPTLAGQVARTGNRYRTQTYIDKNKKTPSTVQRFAQQQQAKIPGLNNQLTPYYDQWGRKQDNGNVVGRALQNFASPGYVSTDKSTAVDDEVMRLYKETKDSAVLPGYADKKFSLDGEYKHLTAKEYETFAKVKGQTSYKIIEELLNNPHYKVLDSDEQADAIAKAYSYAQAKAKEEVSDYELSKQEKLIDKNPVYGVMGATAFKTEADKDKNGSIKTEEAVAYLDSRNFTVAQKALLFECMCPTVKNNPYK